MSICLSYNSFVLLAILSSMSLLNARTLPLPLRTDFPGQNQSYYIYTYLSKQNKYEVLKKAYTKANKIK